MPANYPIESIYLQTGGYTTENNASLYKPGELGARALTAAGHEWQRVQLDSGATSATPVGAVAAGQLAYWRNGPGQPPPAGQNGTAYVVTNDSRMALGGGTPNSGFRDFVAGVFQPSSTLTNGYTPGYFICIQTLGPAVNNLVLKSGDTPSVGDRLVSDNTAGTAQVHSVTSGTAIQNNQVGVVTGAVSSGAVPANITCSYTTGQFA